MVEQMETMNVMKGMSEWLVTLSKYAGFGTAIATELMIGFQCGIGVILATGVVDGLKNCGGALTSSK